MTPHCITFQKTIVICSNFHPYIEYIQYISLIYFNKCRFREIMHAYKINKFVMQLYLISDLCFQHTLCIDFAKYASFQ